LFLADHDCSESLQVDFENKGSFISSPKFEYTLFEVGCGLFCWARMKFIRIKARSGLSVCVFSQMPVKINGSESCISF